MPDLHPDDPYALRTKLLEDIEDLTRRAAEVEAVRRSIDIRLHDAEQQVRAVEHALAAHRESDNREQEVIRLRSVIKELNRENEALREGEDGWRGAWPCEAFAAMLRQSELTLTEWQVQGVSLLVRDAVAKWVNGSARDRETVVDQYGRVVIHPPREQPQ